jgi:uncharacterized protein (DUF2236 family)
VNAEPEVLFGGGRALLMQVAHPKVAAGVEHHSTYATDPWGRLFKTVDVMSKLAFGTPEISAARSKLLNTMHKRVVGTTEEGEAYDALDPDLLLWVWATLCDTALLMYENVHPPLSPSDRAEYYEEWKLLACACHVPRGHCPETWDDFQAYVDRVVADDLRVTNAARMVAHAIAVPPLPWPLGALSARPNQAVTAGFLPASLREPYGLVWDARRQRELNRFLTMVRIGSRVTPRFFRELGFRYLVRRRNPLRFPWLQRRGAVLTERRMSELELPASTS